MDAARGGGLCGGRRRRIPHPRLTGHHTACGTVDRRHARPRCASLLVGQSQPNVPPPQQKNIQRVRAGRGMCKKQDPYKSFIEETRKTPVSNLIPGAIKLEYNCVPWGCWAEPLVGYYVLLRPSRGPFVRALGIKSGPALGWRHRLTRSQPSVISEQKRRETVIWDNR